MLKKSLIASCLATLTLLVLFTFSSCWSGKESSEKVFKIGIQVSPAMTLVMVAKEQEFFASEGVNVEIEEFTAGKFALQAFLTGSVDFAISGEVPVALATLQGNEVRVIAQVVEKTTNEVRIVANDDGIADPAEYFKIKKRKLATSFGGGPEFYTYRFLQKHGIKDDQVELISQKPADMPAALRSGTVDAIAIFDPFAFIAEKQVGGNSITFADENLYSELYVLDATQKQLNEYPNEIKGILRALKRAAEFIEENPDESKETLQKWTKLDREVVDGVWENFEFRPALTDQLLEYWHAQAEWAKATGKVKSGVPTPDYRKVIDESFLKSVDESAVKISPATPVKKAG